MSLQSKSFDPVFGLHVHWLVYPAPNGAVILPGYVLSVGMVMPDLAGAVIGLVRDLIGLPTPDTSVLVHGCKATATGSDVAMVHAVPMGGPLSPTEDIVGDSGLFYGAADVLVGADAKYAVRLGDPAMGCTVAGRWSLDVLLTLQLDVLSGSAASFDSQTYVDDLVARTLGTVLEQVSNGSDVLVELGVVVWSCHEEILAFYENPTEETAAALGEKLGEEVIDAAVGAALEAVLGATDVKISMRELARRRVRRPRPRPPGLRRRPG